MYVVNNESGLILRQSKNKTTIQESNQGRIQGGGASPKIVKKYDSLA